MNFKENLIKIFKDKPFGQILKNSTVLFSGNVVSSIIMLATFSIISRYLGAEILGIFTISQTYVFVLRKFLTLQSEGAVIKFGTELIHISNYGHLTRMLSYILRLDFCLGLLSFIFAYYTLVPLSNFFDWSTQVNSISSVLMFSLLFNFESISVGIIQMLNKHKFFSLNLIFISTLKLAVSLFAYILELDFLSFIIGWTVIEIFSQVTLLLIAIYLSTEFGFSSFISRSPKKIYSEIRGLNNLLLSLNFSTSLKLLYQQSDILIASYFFNDSNVGLYKVAKQLSQLASKVADPLNQAFFPIVSDLNAKNEYNHLLKLLHKTISINVILVLSGLFIYTLFGNSIIQLLFGSAFEDSFLISVIMISSIGVWIIFIGFTAPMIVFGLSRQFFYSTLVSSILSLISQLVFVNFAGLIGLAFGYASYHIIFSLLSMAIVNKKIEKLKLKTEIKKSE